MASKYEANKGLSYFERCKKKWNESERHQKFLEEQEESLTPLQDYLNHLDSKRNNSDYQAEIRKASDSEKDGDALWLIRQRDKEKRGLQFATAEQVLIDRNVEYEIPNDGCLLIKNDWKLYYFWPSSNKWRAKGNNTVYRSKGIDDFLDRFVFK